MEIIRNTCKEIHFKELHEGDVFITVNEKKLYMKTSKAYKFPENPDHYLNAVYLENGTLVIFGDWEKVRIPKKVTLTVDE